MKNLKQLLFGLLLVVPFLFANAQTISCYFPKEYVADAGSTFTVSVKVDSLANVGGFGFSVNWDTTVLKYVGVDSLGISLNEFSGFNEANTEQGKIGISWISPTAIQGLTLPDSTTLFSIIFEAIGNTGDTTSLYFTNDPTPREFADLNAELLADAYTNGFVTLTGEPTTGTNFNSAPEKISLYPPTPNPFYESTLIKFDLRQAAQTNIKIVDQLGKVLFEQQQYLSPGIQNISISKDVFQHSGTYFCLIQSSDFWVTQKIMYIGR